MREALHAAIDAGAGDLVVDVSGVDLVDATGLGVLLGAHRRAAQAGRRVVLRDASPRLVRILRLARLHRVFAVEPARLSRDPHPLATARSSYPPVDSGPLPALGGPRWASHATSALTPGTATSPG